jgi:hypothetical protein
MPSLLDSTHHSARVSGCCQFVAKNSRGAYVDVYDMMSEMMRREGSGG